MKPLSRSQPHNSRRVRANLVLRSARSVLDSATAATLERYREVVARHLAQVTPDEVVEVHWQEAGPAATA